MVVAEIADARLVGIHRDRVDDSKRQAHRLRRFSHRTNPITRLTAPFPPAS
jgi:hypothetical protein